MSITAGRLPPPMSAIGEIVEIVAGVLRPRAALPVAGDRAVHQGGVDLPERIPAEAQAVHDAGPELLDQNLGLGDERQEPRDLLRVLEVERQAALAAVEQREAQALAVQPGRVAAHAVALAGALDLDHLGAGLGQQQGGQGPGQQGREVEHAQALERPHGPGALAVCGGGAGHGKSLPAWCRGHGRGKPGAILRPGGPAAPGQIGSALFRKRPIMT
jgi:hypothetical protein